MECRRPHYYDQFQCLGGACPDSCCREWDVEVDPDTAAFYGTVPGSLGEKLRGSLYREDDRTYLRFNEKGECPLWREDGLCGLQSELGEQALSQVCRQFPRIQHDFGDFMELGLELSCPEAARLILTEPHRPYQTEQAPGEPPDYDRQAMEVLLQARDTALDILADKHYSVPQALALVLLWGYAAQQWLDEDEKPDFDPAAALQTAEKAARPGGGESLRRFFGGLEILTERWKERLEYPEPVGPWIDAYRNLAAYFAERYFLQAVSDYDLAGRVKLAVISCVLIHELGGALFETAQLYSKEIENDADNVDAILDGAYDSPALTDAGLLGLLLKP